jgi:hypothetical protein
MANTNLYIYAILGVLLIALVGGGLFLLAVMGYAVLSPQLTYFVGPGFNANPGGGGDVQQAFSDFQQPPIFAVLREWPNGSWSAQVWVYNPNTLPMRGQAFIKLIAPNGSWLWWGATGQPHTSGTGETSNVVCPFTLGYTDEWTWTNASVKSTVGTVSPPGFFSQLNEPGWNASVGIREAYPVGTTETFELFVYVGNHTWVATPAAPAVTLGTNPFQIYPQEIPPDFPYRNLVTDINNGPLPSWWGHPGLASCP